jgi:predicted RNA-binding Zn-ribbon protein involved in translation (DUF1610 family)
MQRKWTPTDWEGICKRNAGRRRYNSVRKLRAMFRRNDVATVAARHGLMFYQHGAQARIARELKVSRSTVCRDVAAIMAEARAKHACPLCGTALTACGS